MGNYFSPYITCFLQAPHPRQSLLVCWALLAAQSLAAPKLLLLQARLEVLPGLEHGTVKQGALGKPGCRNMSWRTHAFISFLSELSRGFCQLWCDERGHVQNIICAVLSRRGKWFKAQPTCVFARTMANAFCLYTHARGHLLQGDTK